MNFPVFDLHCDTALALWKDNFTTCDSLYENTLHVDLKRALTLPGYAQCFACFTTTSNNHSEGLSPEIIFQKEISAILDQIERHSNIINIAKSATEITDHLQNGKMSALMTIEGPAGFGFQVDKLEELYSLGFRMTTLGWNEDNPLTGSWVTGGGLTEQGRAYVRKAQQLGMVVDVSHISDAGFWDIVEIASKPMIASHSNSRKMWNVGRNLTDEMYLAVCRSGGTVGINLYSEFLGEDPDLDTVCDHVFHFINISGSDRHVSLGADFDGCSQLPMGISGVQDYPRLAERLLQRGLTEISVRNIFWNNALGVIDRCSM